MTKGENKHKIGIRQAFKDSLKMIGRNKATVIKLSAIILVVELLANTLVKLKELNLVPAQIIGFLSLSGLFLALIKVIMTIGLIKTINSSINNNTVTTSDAFKNIEKIIIKYIGYKWLIGLLVGIPIIALRFFEIPSTSEIEDWLKLSVVKLSLLSVYSLATTGLVSAVFIFTTYFVIFDQSKGSKLKKSFQIAKSSIVSIMVLLVFFPKIIIGLILIMPMIVGAELGLILYKSLIFLGLNIVLGVILQVLSISMGTVMFRQLVMTHNMSLEKNTRLSYEETKAVLESQKAIEFVYYKENYRLLYDKDMQWILLKIGTEVYWTYKSYDELLAHTFFNGEELKAIITKEEILLEVV